MKRRRLPSVAILAAVLFGVGWMFVQVIWVPLYRSEETARFIKSQDQDAVEVEIERTDGTGRRSWSIADPKAIAKLRAGLQAAEAASKPQPPASDEKYRLRIRRNDSRVDEYEVVLGAEGRMQDRLYVIRRSGDTSVYGTAYDTPEVRSALQAVTPPVAPKK